jgi:hypothetical protein
MQYDEIPDYLLKIREAFQRFLGPLRLPKVVCCVEALRRPPGRRVGDRVIKGHQAVNGLPPRRLLRCLYQGR